MGLFDELSDADFEVLIADLFTREMGQRFEAFAPGADGGVDARRPNGRHLVQCKHYRRSSFSHLRSQATKQRKKLDDIGPAPDRFDFVTSMDLTSGNKDTLVTELDPFATSHEHIWGYKDVEQLLRKHEDVQRTHVKLWLRSSAQLDRLLNNAAYERTHALLLQIQAALPRYVQTAAMREASRLLAQERVCIVSGPPGVGKTTLAYLLLLQAVELRFQPFEVVADVEEAWRLHKPSEPQVFFFDDFLGRTQLSDGTSSDPRSLVRLIKEIARQDNKRLILTTRQYVLQDARDEVEELARHNFDAHRFLLTLDRYGPFEKARIFYNHIWASDFLSDAARDSLLQDQGYRRIVNHPGYSPRLIEWMTGLAAYKPTENEQRDYVEYCVSVLDNAEQLWTHAFAQGLDDHARAALVSLASMPVRSRVADLERAFDAYCAVAGLPGGHGHFARSLRQLQDSFVRTLDGGEELVVIPLNPSLIDFLRSYLADHQVEFKRAIAGAAFFEQVVWLWRAQSSWRTEPIVSDLFDRATQLLQRDPLTREIGIYGLMRRSPSRLDPSTLTLSRLREMVPWASDAPVLTSKIEEFVSTAVTGLTEGPLLDFEVVRLLRVVADSPLEAEPLGALIKDRIIAREYKTLPDFDALSDVYVVTPTVFSAEELAGVQEEFEGYLDEVYSDTTEYLQDFNDIEVLESAASGLDITLDDRRMGDVRDAVETYLEENREPDEYDQAPDFDDDDRPRGGRGFTAEMARVDSLFGRLGDA